MVVGVNVLADAGVAVTSELLVRQYAQTLVSKAGTASEARVLALRAQPVWRGRDHFEFAGPDGESQRVLVRACVSSLAVREAISARTPEDYLILLTDRSDADLGLGILARCFNQRVETLDMWVGVEQAFKAHQIDPLLRRMAWAAEPLVVKAPTGGWPIAPTGILTREHALSNLTGEILGLRVSELDPSGLLTWTLDAAAMARFREQVPAVQAGLIDWATDNVGPVAGIAMKSATTGYSVDSISIGLVADVLWPGTSVVSADVVAARVRLEAWTGIRNLPESTARILADSCRGIMQRMTEQRDPARPGILARATALFTDVQYPSGAEQSMVLSAGYEARLRTLAGLIHTYLAEPGAGTARIEQAFTDLLQHEQAASDRQTPVARMAVRLVRWLSVADGADPTTLRDAVHRQARVDAWVDWAAADIWVGSSDQGIAGAWAALFAAVRTRRLSHDRQFAALLADSTERGVLPTGLIPVENLIRDAVVPLATAGDGVLLIVVDGMSVAVASELVEEATRSNWYEIVPEIDHQRTATLAVLPTLTKYSRTSLFAGQLAAGQQADEKRTFPALAGGRPGVPQVRPRRLSRRGAPARSPHRTFIKRADRRRGAQQRRRCPSQARPGRRRLDAGIDPAPAGTAR